MENGRLEPLKMEPPELVKKAEEAEEQTKSLTMTEDLLALVKRLQKEGSLEPQIEDLINRINELQQAKKKSSEELGEAQALWETLHRELDSLNGEKVHLEEVLSKKQEALRILQLHCQRRECGAQKKTTLQEFTEQISIPNSQVTENCTKKKLGLHVEEQLETVMGQHKDLWEFHVLKQRLAWEISALQSSKEQLLTEEKLARAKLEEVELQLSSPPEVGDVRAVHDGLRAELEKFGGQGSAQIHCTPKDGASTREAGPERSGALSEDLEPPPEQ
ncbi:LOW QUALITY PROTEIN: synaptonemal complex central element protein 1-like [Lutra lutra]|uniref:LOW QUALITY PROTEIN: synaptonemal complex central element protein 1-like n=1 Tax=Lutra lutra TaxID=9657 RepID=UPI001FD5E8D5|nr:LOW QUALITY PROTEIN: synaptonemal complex central element protein 1-like [Lutra lutra]